jgi:hypothetical protein
MVIPGANTIGIIARTIIRDISVTMDTSVPILVLRNGFFAKSLIRESEPQLVADSEAVWIRASSESEN